MLKKGSQNLTLNIGSMTVEEKMEGKMLEKHSGIKVSEAKGIFASWLRKLPTQERYLAVKVHSPQLISAVRKAYRRLDGLQASENNGSSKIQPQRKFAQKPTKMFFQGLVMMSDETYLDSVGFDFSLIQSPEKLFDTLIYFSQPQENQLSLAKFCSIKSQLSEHIKTLQKVKNKEDLAIIFAKILRHELFCYLLDGTETNLEGQKSRKKQYTVVWKNISEQNKRKLLLLGHSDTKQLTISLLDKKLLIPSPQELEQEIIELLKMDKNQFCNRIFKKRFKKSYILLEDYHQLVFEMWKLQIQQKKKKKKNKKLKKKKTLKEKRNKSLGVQSNQTNQSQHKSKLTHPLNVAQLVQLKIRNDIISYSDYISQQANKFYERKVQAFNRIQYLLGVYFQTKISLFGSCACGLSIKNSDIDIAIDEQFLMHFSSFPQTKQVSIALDYLAEVLLTRPWIKNLKVIRTAAIPIINLTIDTSIQMMEAYMSDYDYNRLNSTPNKGPIDVDLTIQTKDVKYGPSHLGINSTKQICLWLQQIQCLHEIIILLKYYLTMKSLNDTYSGGLKTYTLIVMIIAYIWDNKLQLNGKIQQIFEGLTKFYGYHFDEVNVGIDIKNKQKIFYTKTNYETSSAQLEIKDPINGKILTKSCYQFGQIKAFMREIYQQCFEKNKQTVLKICSEMNPKYQKLTIQQILEKCKGTMPINPFALVCNN